MASSNFFDLPKNVKIMFFFIKKDQISSVVEKQTQHANNNCQMTFTFVPIGKCYCDNQKGLSNVTHFLLPRA